MTRRRDESVQKVKRRVKLNVAVVNEAKSLKSIRKISDITNPKDVGDGQTLWKKMTELPTKKEDPPLKLKRVKLLRLVTRTDLMCGQGKDDPDLILDPGRAGDLAQRQALGSLRLTKRRNQ